MSMIHIGATSISKETADNVADAIVKVIGACYKARFSDKSISKALSALHQSLSVNNINLKDINLTTYKAPEENEDE
jgi:hypothetical protein